ncbi:GNAT family N-acetyltransferase [Microvirga antarctica]|uniref:GNAT family N-acetyltransferase n=1 Tax=Microvirga antarctica TaxID=2819233 RepID=UPI001B30BC80|nr:GNAT family N-acetyltransferase [Microvirga antarctica]
MEPILIETDSPPAGAYQALLSALRSYTAGRVGPPDNHDFAILIGDPDCGDPVGGLWAQSRWGGFHIDMLVVPESMRRQGIGSGLLQRAEAEARRRSCLHLWLETYAFQARPFYERHGFSVFGQIDGPAPIYPRYFMTKPLD